MVIMSIKKAATINILSKYTSVLLQIFYGAILARLLTPDDFGIVAITTVFTTFFLVFSDMGFGVAVIQNKTLKQEELNDIFSFTVYLAIILSIIFALFSYPLAFFYNNNVYIPICSLLSISVFFNTITMIPNAILMKNKQFAKVGIRVVMINLISGLITVYMALNGFKYFALVLNAIIVSIFTFIWSCISVDIRFKFRINMQSIHKIKEFSMYQFAFSFVNYFSRNLDNLIIGKVMGNSALGYYDKAYRLMLYPVGNLSHVISPILQPILSEYQANKIHIYDKYIAVIKILSLLGIFASAYCFLSAREIVLIMFGDQWADSIPSFKFLALSIWAQMVTSTTGAIFQSIGSTKLLFFTGILNSSISIVAILMALTFGKIEIVAIFVSVAYNLHFFVAFFILIKFGFGYSYKNLLFELSPHLIIFLVTCLGVWLVSFTAIENVILSAICKGVGGIAFYIIGIMITKQTYVFKRLIKK